MPIGEPNQQTKSTDKWQKKAGYISKSFKVKKEIADEFGKICKEKGESQAKLITGFMLDFIAKNKS